MSDTGVGAARLVLILLIAIFVGGCGPAASPAGSDLTVVPLPTQEPVPPGPPRVCMAALTAGTLVRHAGSGLGIRAPEGRVRQVIWPHGYTARLDGVRLALLDATGTIVAYEGDRIELGGGEIDDIGTWQAC